MNFDDHDYSADDGEPPDDTTAADDADGDLVDKGLARLPRNDDGEVEHDELRQFIADRLVVDLDAERLRRAELLITRRRRPGVAPAEGQLHFPGLDPYDYEPGRLVLGADDTIVENHRAKPAPKAAEANRAQENLRRVAQHAQRRSREATEYGAWAVDRVVREGWAWDAITFGRFVQWMRDNP